MLSAAQDARHGLPVTSPREYALIAALQCIVLETMEYPPVRPISADSYLPPNLLDQAQRALAAYGLRCQPQHRTAAAEGSSAIPDFLTRAL